MSTVATLAYGTIATPTWSGFNSLAAGSLVLSSAINNSAGNDDFLIEVTIAAIAGGASGNKQILVYAVSSIDGSTYSDTANLTNLRRIGFVDVTGSTSYVMAAASVAAAFSGICPPYFRLAVYNDAGSTLASSGNSARVLPITYLAT